VDPTGRVGAEAACRDATGAATGNVPGGAGGRGPVDRRNAGGGGNGGRAGGIGGWCAEGRGATPGAGARASAAGAGRTAGGTGGGGRSPGAMAARERAPWGP
jgi:hypothetical protein